MGRSIKLFNIWNIPIGIDLSWFLIFILIAWSFSTGFLAQQYPNASPAILWPVGILTSLVFFGSVLAHELGHSFIALRNKIPVKSITLFFFGGLAQIGQEPRTPGAEFRIAIAGPIVSLLLAGLFTGLRLVGGNLPYLGASIGYLASINLILGLFNLLPGFPLDGGRIFRAIAWKITGDFHRATQIAARGGQAVAFGLIAFGVFSAFSGQLSGGIWLGLIGLFLLSVASSTLRQTDIEEKLEDVTVAQVMARDFPHIPANTPLSQLVAENLPGESQGVFLVQRYGEDESVGVVTLQDVRNVPQRSWGFTTVEQVMKPLSWFENVTPETSLKDALQKMQETQKALLKVVDGTQLRGILSRDQVWNYLRLRSQIGW
jgi:Zn-dependent protease